jgi:hypothetical protein
LHKAPAYAPLAGEIRFRITPSSDTNSFALGTDLLQPDLPIPWGISLIHVLKKGIYQHLAQLLLHHDRSASESMVSAVHAMGIYTASPIIHSLGQPFRYDLANPEVILTMIRGVSVNRTPLVFNQIRPADGTIHRIRSAYTGQYDHDLKS